MNKDHIYLETRLDAFDEIVTFTNFGKCNSCGRRIENNDVKLYEAKSEDKILRLKVVITCECGYECFTQLFHHVYKSRISKFKQAIKDIVSNLKKRVYKM